MEDYWLDAFTDFRLRVFLLPALTAVFDDVGVSAARVIFFAGSVNMPAGPMKAVTLEVLLPLGGDSVICKMPFSTENDMEVVARMLRKSLKEPIDVTPQTVPLSDAPQRELRPSGNDSYGSHCAVRTQDNSTGSQVPHSDAFTGASGISETLPEQIMPGKKQLSLRPARKLVPYLTNSDKA